MIIERQVKIEKESTTRSVVRFGDRRVELELRLPGTGKLEVSAWSGSVCDWIADITPLEAIQLSNAIMGMVGEMPPFADTDTKVGGTD